MAQVLLESKRGRAKCRLHATATLVGADSEAPSSTSSFGRLREWWQRLRLDMVIAKRAAVRTGWWADLDERFEEEEVRARAKSKPKSQGWWYDIQDSWAEEQLHHSG